MTPGAAPQAADPRRAVWMGLAAFVITAVFWGANMPLTAVLLRTFDPFWLTLWRVVLASIALGAMVWTTEGRAALRVDISWSRFLLLSLAVSIFYVDYNLALRYTNTITAAAVLAGAPIYAVTTLWLITRTPFERGFGAAALLTIVGGAIAIYGRAASSGGSLRLDGGEPLVVLSIVLWTLYSILAQRWFPPAVSQLRRAYVASLGAIFWLFLFWVACRAAGLAGPPNVAPGGEAILWLLVTAVFATAVGSFTWNIGVSRLGIAMGSLWQNAVPAFGVLIAMLFGIQPAAEQVIGGIVVMAGVLYMQWRRFRT
ncbi:MAG TPA: DMT family transporter [Vineibacter sp.]|nr:DMT family transporter [Vineibacter sp.]